MKKKIGLAVLVFLLLFFTGNVAGNVFAAGSGQNYFTDVPNNYWAKNDIDYFVRQGIVQGIGNNRFAPELSVTREQFATMLTNTFNQPLLNPGVATFADVPRERWSYPYVETSKEFLTGYANPFGDKPAFFPAEPATREDIVVAMVLMMGLTDKDAWDGDYATIFEDWADITPALLPYISVAAERGIIRGYEDGTFAPLQGITRAEAVTLLRKATKQPLTAIKTELELEVTTETGSNPKEVKVIIQTEEGASVTVNGKAVKMKTDKAGRYVGEYLYKFTKEGNKTLTVVAAKAGKKKMVDTRVSYEMEAPILNLIQCPSSVMSKEVTIKGRIEGGKEGASLLINSIPEKVDKAGNWQKSFTLVEGYNTFTFEAFNSAGKSVAETRTIFFSAGDPLLSITQCPPSVTKKDVVIKGTLKDNNYDAFLMINGKPVTVKAGNWQESYVLEEGVNTFNFIATNEVGRTVTEEREIEFTPGSPKISFINCPSITEQENITIIGRVDGEIEELYLFVNDQEWKVSGGRFRETVTLVEGLNFFEFRAVNGYGRDDVENIVIIRI